MARMTLAEYLAREGITQTEFGRRVGVGHSVVSRWVRGERQPEWPMLVRIREATAGAVQPNDFLKAEAA